MQFRDMNVMERITATTVSEQREAVRRQLIEVIPERLWEHIAEIAETRRNGNSSARLYSLKLEKALLVFVFLEPNSRRSVESLYILP